MKEQLFYLIIKFVTITDEVVVHHTEQYGLMKHGACIETGDDKRGSVFEEHVINFRYECIHKDELPLPMYAFSNIGIM